MKTRDLLISGLTKLLNAVEEGHIPEPTFGICRNIQIIHPEIAYDILACLWGNMGLDRFYPVENECSYFHAVHNNLTWKGHRRESRIDVMERALKFLEENPDLFL